MATEKKVGRGRKKKDPNRFIEKDKTKNLNPYREIPKSGRLKCKVFNLEAPGSDIQGCINRVNFSIQHGSIVDLHPSQIEVLNNAVIDTMEYYEEVPGYKMGQRPSTRPRFMVQVMGITDKKADGENMDDHKTDPNITTTEAIL